MTPPGWWDAGDSVVGWALEEEAALEDRRDPGVDELLESTDEVDRPWLHDSEDLEP